MPNAKQDKVAYLSDTCVHKYTGRLGKEVVKTFQLVKFDGQVYCPRCKVEGINKLLEDRESGRFEESEKERAYQAFEKESIVTDMTLLNARLNNFVIDRGNQEQANNLADVKKFADAIEQGEVFNVFTQGQRGAGKSHLMYGLAHELNERFKGQSKRVLFVEIKEMLDLIKDSFNNKQSMYTEMYFKKLLSEADILVLDDLGAETGAIDTEKNATNFTVNTLYGVMTARQDKVTLTTSNLSGKQLFKMYDKKLVSRLMKNPRYIVFTDITKDKRVEQLPF
ncbi:replication initiator/regulator DnaA [Bacillus phage poppyseed]|nr:replication initiator/regulator DnaA [Bacillus phage poppyseed]